MVIIILQNKITYFFMILAWVTLFNPYSPIEITWNCCNTQLQVDVNHLDMYNQNQNLCQGSKLPVYLLQVVLFEVQTIRIKTAISKRCSFECDMGKYSTRPMKKVWAFRRTLYSLDMCYIFPYRTKNEQRLYFLTRSSHIWHDCQIIAVQTRPTARVRYGLIPLYIS